MTRPTPKPRPRPRRAGPPVRRPREAAVSPELAALVGTSLELEVGAVGSGGVCVARDTDGRAVLVRHALPGERVRAVVTEARPRYLRADAVEVIGDPSPDRVEEPCVYARPGRCGGCHWQHATLPAQRRLKAEMIRGHLSHQAGLDLPVEVEEVPDAPGAAGPGLGWRTRVQWAVADDGTVGLRRHREREVEDVDRCLIAHERVTEVGVERRRWPDTAAVEVLVAGPPTDDRAVVVTPARGELAVPSLDAPTAVLQGDAKGRVTPVRGRPGLRETAMGRTWRVSGSGFWQVHPAAAETLSGAVLDALQPQPGEAAVDLYCGVGLFAGVLGERLGLGGRVTAVEADVQAADDARHNLRDLNAQVLVETGRVEDVLLKSGLRRADLVVLDPPRSGAGRPVVDWIASLRPRAIAYVSCDPATLARDLASFQAEGYAVTGVRAFDLFPMTAHVECVARLEHQA